jgi:HD superfamily phosphohydrolase
MAKTFFGAKHTQFMDPVHGGISVMKHEVACIDHPLFQRLRYIFQNDVAHFVFPGATQTRFSHSIGVMHLAGRMFSVLIEEYASESSSEFTLSNEHTEAIYYVYSCFRLAALLHDTGHFPFSHEFEHTTFINKILSDKQVLQDFWGSSELYEKYAKDRLEQPDFVAAHEDYSLAVAYNILYDVKNSDGLHVEIDDVLCLMEANSGSYTKTWKKHCVKLFEVLEGNNDASSLYAFDDDFIASGLQKYFSLMISGELDVDKMDYLLRDSYFSGSKYGVYNLDHLLSTIRIGFNPKDSNWVGLAILEKGVVALEDFVYSRFQIYQNIWSHKAVVGNKVLLSEALKELETADLITKIRNYIANKDNFAFFTDHFFMELFREKSMSANNKAAKNFLFRARYQHLMRLENPSAGEIKLCLKQLEQQYGQQVKYRKVKIKFSQIPEHNDGSVRVIKRTQPNAKRELIYLDDYSDFFSKFNEMLFVNFYILD